MRIPKGFAIAMAIALLTAPMVQAQTAVKSGFNVFSAQQDVELGRQSAGQIERQLPMLSDPNVTRYVSRIGARLVAFAPGERYPYQFKVVNLSDINAFALPGGFIYIHRGLIEKVRSEGELAGVMAHEISHVALRHQTNQASKKYLAQAGVGVLVGLLGGKSGNRVMQAVGGFGLNALFLRYSRTAEAQADIVGSQIMARAGYDPNDMARFFDMLRQEAGRDPGKVERFFSDHPDPADRAARVRREAASLHGYPIRPPIGGLNVAQADLRRLPPAPTLAQAMKGAPASTQGNDSPTPSFEAPSASYRLYRQPRGMFELQIPDNWQVHASTYGAAISPRDGLVQTSDGRQDLRAGAVVGHYVPFDGSVGTGYEDPRGSLYGNASLEQATSDLVRQITGAYPHLRTVSTRRGSLSGGPSMTVVLAGTPRGSADQERMTLTTRELSDGHVIYILSLASAHDYPFLEPAFNRMARSLNVNEQATHD